MPQSKQCAESLSELEGTTLAIIKEAGECTPYVVRDVFRNSPTENWSGSAGAIYPLIARLEKKGILLSTEEQVGKRKRTLYRLSADGEKALKNWLLDVKSGAGIGLDPMRTRLAFADMYGADELHEYVRQAMDYMMAEIPPPKSDNPLLEKTHQIWLSHRKAAVEEILLVLERG